MLRTRFSAIFTNKNYNFLEIQSYDHFGHKELYYIRVAISFVNVLQKYHNNDPSRPDPGIPENPNNQLM
jgi:hypothetical protein